MAGPSQDIIGMASVLFKVACICIDIQQKAQQLVLFRDACYALYSSTGRCPQSSLMTAVSIKRVPKDPLLLLVFGVFIPQVSALERLEELGVKWVVSRRCRDLELLNPAALGWWCDPTHLAWCMALSGAAGGRPIIEVVDAQDDPNAARALDSEIIGVTGPAWAHGPGLSEAAGSVFAQLLAPDLLPPPGAPFPVVCELKESETSSAVVRNRLETVRLSRPDRDVQAGAALPLATKPLMQGIGAYFFPLSSLKGKNGLTFKSQFVHSVQEVCCDSMPMAVTAPVTWVPCCHMGDGR